MAILNLQSFTRYVWKGMVKHQASYNLCRMSTINPEKGQELLKHKRKEIKILDSSMSYLDTDVGDETVLFLHGNPTSSYLWRNIIPHVQPIARCLAPDLIGMGQSEKLPGSQYRFVDQYKYLSKWIEEMKLPPKINLVVQDWGSALGFHWSNMNRDRVASISYFEAIIKPFKNWEDFPELVREGFQALRSPKGEEMILRNNMFLTTMLPTGILRKLSDDEMSHYMAPFVDEGESRRPTLTFPREMPIVTDGPSDVVKIVENYYQWMSNSKDIPKLFIHVEPGFFSPRILEVVKDWPNNKVVTMKGHHFAQEDSPHEIGEAVKSFLLHLRK